MAPVRRAPYKDFLQPSLHRRFTSTTSILLGIAFIESVLLASWKSPFWAIFPIGPTGIRSIFISVCGLFVIILRIAQYHVGFRSSNSGLHTFTKYALSLQTVEAIFMYTVSSWLFSQVYLWSSSAEDLDWILIHSGDRARLNEKPIFYTVNFIIFGVIQGVLHVLRDDDMLLLGSVKLSGDDAAAKESAASWQQRVVNEVPALASLAAMQSAAVLAFNIVIYHAVLRSPAWQTALLFFRPFYTLPKTNMVPATLAGINFWMWTRCFLTGFMLLFLWFGGNRLFSLLLVRPPLKLGNPLTSESKDMNGSLLNGLKSKKLPIKCFATWELALIARDFQPRRKLIFQDIDRKDGPMWSQVYSLCLNVVKDLEARVDSYGEKPDAPSADAVVAKTSDNSTARPITHVSNEQILLSTPTKKTLRSEVEKVVGQNAMSPGQKSRLSPIVQKGLTDARGVVNHFARQAAGTDSPDNALHHWTKRALDSPLGVPFKQTYRRRLAAVVLGTPYGEPSLVINAISALTRLAIFSLAEDNYGNVQRDVSSIIRTFTMVVTKLEKFKAEFPVHWTDFEGTRECAEVDAILATLKEGLKQLIASFGPYARDLRLTFADMRHAREAAGIPNRDRDIVRIEAAPPEMRQLR